MGRRHVPFDNPFPPPRHPLSPPPPPAMRTKRTLYSSLSSSVSRSKRLAPMWRVVGPVRPRAHKRSSLANRMVPRRSQTHSRLSRKDTRAKVTLLFMV